MKTPVTIIRLLFFFISFSLVLVACKKDKSLPSPSLSITNIADSGCTVSWAAVSGASSYTITLAKDAAFTNLVTGYNQLTVTGTSIVVTDLSGYTRYYVKVVAVSDKGNGAPGLADFMTLDADALVIVPWDQNSVYAFDGRNGKVKWTFSGVQVFGTPIIQDSVVYFGAMDGRLYALNVTDGSQKWKTAAASNGSQYTANPLIKNGVVYIGDYGGTCHAYNVSDGSAKWSFSVPSTYRNIGTSPLLNGSTVYFASYDGKIYALDALTGAYKWSTASTGNPITSGMALANGTIYVGALPKVYAFDANTGVTKWISPAPVFTLYDSSPTIAGNAVIIGGGDGNMYAFNTADGSVIWSKTLGTGSIMSSPILKDGIIYIGGGDGKIYALQSSNGNTVWQNNSTGSTQNIYCGPTLSDRAVYSGTLGGKMAAMDILTGATKWITTVPGARFQASPAVISFKGTVYYPGLSGDVQ